MNRIEKVINQISDLNENLMIKTQQRLDSLTKPRGSLGRLEEIAKKIVGVTGYKSPKLDKKYIVTVAGDHGVADEGVSAYPKEVTSQMVYNFLQGGAAINVLARHVGARVIVVDMGVATEIDRHPDLISKKIGYGTENMAKGPAMTYEQATESINAGIEVVEYLISRGCDIIGTGDMGIGNTTASSAIAAVICDTKVEYVTGRGTGVDDESYINKIKVIEKSLSVNKPDSKDPIDILSKVGGFEIGGIAGVILGASANKIPVVIDGFISGAGALIAFLLSPKTKNYMIASHCSVERGHQIVLKKLNLKPLLDFDLRLGEGTGAALGINIVEASVKILNEMTTFGEAGVSKEK